MKYRPTGILFKLLQSLQIALLLPSSFCCCPCAQLARRMFLRSVATNVLGATLAQLLGA